MKRSLILALLFLLSLSAWAQPANDECGTAIGLQDVNAFCSDIGAYTTVGATASPFPAPACFGNVHKDVWFKFTALATDVNITIRGAIGQANGGTLQDPQIALYSGNCATQLNLLGCEAATGNNNIIELNFSNLFVGSTYLIRVQGSNAQSGTFQLCINNFNPPHEPSSDCPESSVLCDKSSFSVLSVSGAGQVKTELNDATCFSGGGPGGNTETNSTWFSWTCAKSGTLTFTLSPLNVADDLDFVVYRLPNGPKDCQGKSIVRCMASGATSPSSPCMGDTGLRENETDTDQGAGCFGINANAWLAPLNMMAGESYALCVNNYTSTGNGFSVEFGGSGQFVGPKAEFTTLPQILCTGNDVEIQDQSSFTGGQITGWNWSFGAGSSPETAQGQGPHEVQFNSEGTHFITLVVQTDLGCKVTAIRNVNVLPGPVAAASVTDSDCSTANGAIEIQGVVGGTAPFSYSWNNASPGDQPSLQNISPGQYTVRILDANQCEYELELTVAGKPLIAETDMQAPQCAGDANGVISLDIENGLPPFAFDWGNGFVPQDSQSGLSAGQYTVTVTDASVCSGVFTIELTEFPALDLQAAVEEISCFGANDAWIAAEPSGGAGGYTYSWSTQANSQEIGPLGEGIYQLSVTDQNGCVSTLEISISSPSELVLKLDSLYSLPCFGIPQGSLEVTASGGRPDFSYNINDGPFGSDPVFEDLYAGTYVLRVRDAAGCLDSVEAVLDQPAPIEVVLFPEDTLLNLGEQLKINTFHAGDPLTYLWSPGTGLSDSTIAEPLLTATENQLYILQSTDDGGCYVFDTLQLRVNQYRPVFFPNAISPGDDSENSFFTGFGGVAAEEIVELRVFNRWGDIVFETRDIPLNDPPRGWDGRFRGKDLSGVFAWTAKVRFIDQVEQQYSGSLSVLR